MSESGTTAAQASQRRKTFRVAGLIILLGAAAGWGTWRWQEEHEPHYRGHNLSYWLAVLGDDQNEDGGEAHLAIRILGTNALPRMLCDLVAEDPQWKQFCHEWVYQVFGNRVRLRTARHRSDAALSAFRTLGPAAAPALPELFRTLREPRLAFRSAEAIAAIGPSSITTLASLLNDPEPEVRIMATRAIGWLAKTSNTTLGPLATASTDRHSKVRLYAVEGLGHLADPRATRLIAARLNDESRLVQVTASNTLSRLITAAGRIREQRLTDGSRAYYLDP